LRKLGKILAVNRKVKYLTIGTNNKKRMEIDETVREVHAR
jgi:uncharacterized protein YlbG (UPF0298 family)